MHDGQRTPRAYTIDPARGGGISLGLSADRRHCSRLLIGRMPQSPGKIGLSGNGEGKQSMRLVGIYPVSRFVPITAAECANRRQENNHHFSERMKNRRLAC